MTTLPESSPPVDSQVNGVGASDKAAANVSGFSGNASLPATDLEVSAKAPAPLSTPDINPAGPAPVDDVASGIQPIADFVPKDASTLSHPTPPPDEPLNAGDAEVDVEMANAENDAPILAAPEATPALSEQSLVRPREDDGEDQPAAKRTRMDEDVVAPLPEVPPAPADVSTLQDAVTSSTSDDAGSDQVVDKPFEEAVSAEQVVEDVVPEPSPAPVVSAETDSGAVKLEVMQTEAQIPDASAPSIEASAPEQKMPDTQPKAELGDVKPMDNSVPATVETTSVSAPAQAETTPVTPTTIESSNVKASAAPMTQFQKATLVEKMKNLKKTKHSMPFLRPVDYVALNIPTYPDIIKQPMDLGTMDHKLKHDEYGSVKDFVDDFELIIANVRRFNGEQHAITGSGLNMKAYFDRMMESVPSADQEPPKAKAPKHRSPSIAQEPKRREARAAAAPPAPAPQAASPAQQQPFALQSDGTPQIRRASSNARPARAIKPPQNREIPYAKPKRKEHLLELRFSEHVLDEIRSSKYGNLNHVFQLPVDPVALNIPNYHHIIKQPMDLSTMVNKMKSGQYGTAVEFKKDFELMVKNCLIFNPVGNPVRDLAIGLQRQFEALWADKNKWEKKNAPTSARASSASADGDSEEEGDEEEGGDNPDDSTVAALKKQIAAMQSTLESLSGGGAAAKVGAKPAKSHKKGANKKAGASTAASSKAAPKASKPKRERMITYEEKDEISKAVERMDEKQIGKLTEIITRECPKYRDMEEMELEIDDLPNSVQLLLLKYVREIFGNPNKKKAAARDYSPDDVAAQDDDDFEPRSRGAGGAGRGGKRKKHAPMSKSQQEEQLRALQGKLQEFSNAATSGSESPSAGGFNQAAQPESSGDEEEEESEEE